MPGHRRKAWAPTPGVEDKRKRGRAGQAQRQRRLKRTNGLCEMCLAEGRTTVATVVDHRLPLALGGEDVDDNTRNLCGPHDEQVTAEQFGREQPVPARGVGADGRPSSAEHAWNAGPAPTAGAARPLLRPTPKGGGGSK